jgi:hypothetical protein
MPQKSNSRRIMRFFRIVFLISSSSCVVVSFGFVVYTADFVHSAIKTSGQVIRLDERLNTENNSIEYAPVFQFLAGDAKTYTITSGTASNPAGFEVGETVHVLYRSNDPAKARLDSFWQLWLVPVILLFIGLTHGFISGVLLLVERKLNRQASPVADIGN